MMSIINGERYHVSDEEIVKVYDSKQEKSFLKPSGFWYCYANDKEEHEMYPFTWSSLIDWNRVKSDYGGVDFSNYNKRLQTIKFNFVWYGSVDFSSGCIWV